MKKILQFFSAIFLFLSLNTFAQTNPGFETGTTTGWSATAGTFTASTTNARTGTYSGSHIHANTNGNRLENSSTLSIDNNSYAHLIAWAIGNNTYCEASSSIKINAGNYNSSYSAIQTNLTRITKATQNTTGSTATATFALSSRTSTSGQSITTYWDDVVAYVSTSSTTDLTAPNSPSSVSVSSNEAETTVTVRWTDGTDAATGSQKALVLRTNGTDQTPPTLNNQAQYITGDAVGSWSIKGIVDVGTQTFADNTTSAHTAYTYAVFMRDLAYNYSPGNSSSITALPVELTSFTSNVIGNKVELNWRTATEVNNYGFEILRTAQNDNWEKIGFVNGNGNSNSPKSYSFTDEPTGGKEFKYRLKQIDFDGSYEYSYEVTAKLGNVSDYKLDQNYPNPFNPYTKISYIIPQRAYVHLRVYDILAKEVVELVNTTQESGRYEVTFDGTNLPSGAYFYKLEAGNYIEVKKLLLVK